MASWVESEEKQEICAIVSDVDMWLSRCREAIAAPNADPSMPLKDMLSRVRGPGPVDPSLQMWLVHVVVMTGAGI